MNITLSDPQSVVQNVRNWAEERGISLNSYIRDLLVAKDREICEERKSFADASYSFALANSIEMEPDYKFSREDVAERVMACDR
ncbi:MAG: hypothetical protein J6Z49_03720 [Kiritimatiellae bacterium]|nr:hypothetical protein [Kiritimatiellia bacterium]